MNNTSVTYLSGGFNICHHIMKTNKQHVTQATPYVGERQDQPEYETLLQLSLVDSRHMAAKMTQKVSLRKQQDVLHKTFP